MRSSSIRLLHNASRLLAAGGEACGSSSSGSVPKVALPPVRYHIFNTPLPYPIGLKLQNDIIDRRLDRKGKDKDSGAQDVLLLLEHTPTYTTGRRDNSPNPDTLHPEERKVQNVGAEFFITKRGGQVTYHGPGQLVGYPIFDLNDMGISTRCYVDWMQKLLKGYCSDDMGLKGMLAPHPEGHVGVFASPTEKVSSIGIHLRHRITSHGFAINITPEPLKWFDLVLACGLADVKAISIHDLVDREASASGVLPPRLPTVRDAAMAMVPRFAEAYGREIIPLGKEGGGEEVEELRGLIEEAEDTAERQVRTMGGWASEPDMSGRDH